MTCCSLNDQQSHIYISKTKKITKKNFKMNISTTEEMGKSAVPVYKHMY